MTQFLDHLANDVMPALIDRGTLQVLCQLCQTTSLHRPQ
jgi:hypothetical protein